MISDLVTILKDLGYYSRCEGYGITSLIVYPEVSSKQSICGLSLRPAAPQISGGHITPGCSEMELCGQLRVGLQTGGTWLHGTSYCTTWSLPERHAAALVLDDAQHLNTLEDTAESTHRAITQQHD